MTTPTIDNGGPAFPAHLAYSPEGGAHIASEYFADSEGMSLRDWFAGQALAGRMTHMADQPLAEYCYRIADAMLAARKLNTTSK